MDSEGLTPTAKHAISLVDDFFSNLAESDKRIVAPVILSQGIWIAKYDESLLGIFRLDTPQQERVRQFDVDGWPPFPGLMVAKDQRPRGPQVAIAISGKCGYFSSNHTSNLVAFEVSPGASFTIEAHYHEINDVSGHHFEYPVALAFVLGLLQSETWPQIERRLRELLDHTMGVWRSLQ